MDITGAALFAHALKQEGVELVFGYPGGQAIDLFDALYGQEKPEIILPRHEQALVHAADGYARATGKVGVCLVTSGPGATNLLTGIATAASDGVPLVCFTGQVATTLLGKSTFQEVDIVDMAKSVCKFAMRVHTREELAGIIQQAFYAARSGRPGVALVDIPKDIQKECGSAVYCPIPLTEATILPEAQRTLLASAKTLQNASRPLLLVGAGARKASALVQEFAEKNQIPFISTIMGKGIVSSAHPLYFGNAGIHGCVAANKAISHCDVLFALGTRLNDRVTCHTGSFAPHAKLIHVDIDPTSISRNVPAHIPHVADCGLVLAELIRLVSPPAHKTVDAAKPCNIQPCSEERQSWLKQISGWKSEYPLGRPASYTSSPVAPVQALSPQSIFEAINRVFSHAIITTDVGQNQLWATQFLELDKNRLMLTSGGMGTMGYGLPAAIGAKLGRPDTHVLAITGDGGLQMNIQELATAITCGLPITICLLHNGYLGNVRQWQEMFYNRRYAATCLQRHRTCPKTCQGQHSTCPPYTPDFLRLAESYGLYAQRISTPEDIEPALHMAKARTSTSTLLEFCIPREENVLPIVPPGKGLEYFRS